MASRPRANRKHRSLARPVSQLPPNQKRPIFTRKRSGGGRSQHNTYVPPEDWHEPSDDGVDDYRILVQDPGDGFEHPVTPAEIRARLAELPPEFVAPLEVVQLSRMTSKKKSFPCYGMQWGTAIYLYPLEEGFVEYFSRPPRPAEFNDAKQFGGQWIQQGKEWKLVWSAATLKDYYLNNVLIHELGHLLDKRNSSFRDRERYAEWFAIEHGYKPSRRRG